MCVSDLKSVSYPFFVFLLGLVTMKTVIQCYISAFFLRSTIFIIFCISLSFLYSLSIITFSHTPLFNADFNTRRAPSTVMALPSTSNTVILELSDNPVASSFAPVTVIPHFCTPSLLILLLPRAPTIAVIPSSPILFDPIESSSRLQLFSSLLIHLAPVVISRHQQILQHYPITIE